ncbi:MAG: alanine/glycine:cation symporter family protein, partial [Pseudobdellovibrionaceae bacterium]
MQLPETVNACFGNSEGFDSTLNCLFGLLADKAEATLLYGVPFDTVAADGTVSTHHLTLLVAWLAFAGVFFTLYFSFVNFRMFKHAVDIVRGKFDEPGADGQINNFQALAASLAGTVGLGNIAGVAVAISAGGPGAVIWMSIMGLFGMSSKFTEVVAGVKYRVHSDAEHKDTISGGPMYYLKEAFAKHNQHRFGMLVACLFAIACIAGSLAGGNMFQANQAYSIALNVTGGETSFLNDYGWAFGIGLAILTGLVIIGGIKSIAKISSTLVPLMAVVYIVTCLIIMGKEYANIPAAFATIWASAFTLKAGVGGLIGAILVGVQRASFSNEAGLGSASIVHATAQTAYPIRQGFVAMLGPVIDTVVICNITALTIVITGVYQDSQGVEGVKLTMRAFQEGADWFPYILALSVFLFAYSTLIGWYYYGEKAAGFLFGDKATVRSVFKIIFLLTIVVGASAELSNVVRFSDAMFLSMGIPNIIGLYLLAPEIKKDLDANMRKFFPKTKPPVAKTPAPSAPVVKETVKEAEKAPAAKP